MLPHILNAVANTAGNERVEAADAALDRGYGRRDLAIPKIGRLVQDALLRLNGDRYGLIAWCVMPNHVHVLTETWVGHPLDRVVHSWKSYTAPAANRLLGRRGAFWAPDYFDRYMRDEAHLAATVGYIENNPLRAGLCDDAA